MNSINKTQENKIKILQIGSGSMGTRRMRDLSARQDVEIALLEVQEIFAKRAIDRFGVKWFSDTESALAWGPDTLIISSPPQTHAQFVQIALQNGLNFFCEAELFPYDFREIERVSKENKTIAAPSCTEIFGPVYKKLKEIVDEQLGTLHGYTYTSSLNIRSNRPVGTGKEYYAFNRSTNGTREIVPWALVGLSGLFGMPKKVSGLIRSGGEFGIGMEDSWSVQMLLENGGIGQLFLGGASPENIDKIIAIGTNGLIECNPSQGNITRKLTKLGINDTIHCGSVAQIWEKVYADEIGAYIEALRGKSVFPHDYRKACTLAGALAAAEKSAISGQAEIVDPTFLPAEVPDGYELNQ